MKKYLFFVTAALLGLYYLSSMPYEQQTIVPELRVLLRDQPFYELLSKIEVSYWGRTISVETRGYYYFIEFLFRKTMHFVGYGIVAVLLYLLFRKLKWLFPSIIACICTFSLPHWMNITRPLSKAVQACLKMCCLIRLELSLLFYA